jgi:hypothetical protein
LTWILPGRKRWRTIEMAGALETAAYRGHRQVNEPDVELAS